MVPVIVPAYAAIFAFIYLALSAQVIRARRQAKAAIGTSGDVRLERKIRVHANFAEYVPFALLLLSFVEMQGGPAWLIHLICLAFLAGRAIHAYGLSQVQEDYRLRSTGMAITFAVIAVTALVLVAQGFNYLAASLTSEARRRGGLRRGPRISVVLPTTEGAIARVVECVCRHLRRAAV
jgi:uncharacterized protein